MTPTGKNSLSRRKGDHTLQECNHKLHGVYIHYKPSKATEAKVTVQKIDNFLTRELIVPDRAPIETPAILTTNEFKRLEKQAKVMTLNEKMQMIQDAEKQRNQIQQESLARKDWLMKTQKTQKALPGTKLEAVESEATQKNLYLVKRSEELMIEQDDKVKQANKIILATKCRAIRNAQIAEKKLIEKQLQEENERLEKIMEQTRQRAVKAEEKRKEKAEINKERYIHEVEEQVRENEMNQLIQAEKIEEESRMINKALIAWQKEEEKKMLEKHEIQLQIREDFRRANEQSEYYKALREEEDRISDMRISDFMRKKQQREEAIEKKKALDKATKEREIARMAENQAKSQDIKALMDELNALRAQEEKEKEWREKEKIEATIKQKTIDDLKHSRAKQIEDIRKAQAVALARDEEAFMKVVTRQKLLHEQDVEKQRKRKEETEKHRKYLLRQINSKEKERIQYQQEKFEDGKAQRQEYIVKDRQIKEYLDKKIQNLRGINIPENYIRDIERQMRFIKN
ncbi:unnamed protein product [Diabrotica balteata]|uniref:Cilia- and flagella-associated protein 45 n=1 Tax=Diabrotica balteata TaxID=107213 RepID=A0A9N9XCP1_DIABA|nr:unnamed protein product [Diabrotica balteata]